MPNKKINKPYYKVSSNFINQIFSSSKRNKTNIIELPNIFTPSGANNFSKLFVNVPPLCDLVFFLVAKWFNNNIDAYVNNNYSKNDYKLVLNSTKNITENMFFRKGEYESPSEPEESLRGPPGSQNLEKNTPGAPGEGKILKKIAPGGSKSWKKRPRGLPVIQHIRKFAPGGANLQNIRPRGGSCGSDGLS